MRRAFIEELRSLRAVVLLAAVFVSGCCWMAKRDCFPPCPPAPPAEVVTVEKTCKLPPPLELQAVERATAGCPENLTCYDISNAGKLAERDAQLKGWIREARARCEAPPPEAGSGPGGNPAPGTR